MKGDDTRADQLATMLDGGPVADDIDPFVPAVRRVRELLHRLGPDPERVAALVPTLLQKVIDAQQRPVVELAHPTLLVRDMDAALAFYRDALGLMLREEGKGFAVLDAGGASVALQWTGRATQRSRPGDIRLEFRTDDLDRAVSALRQHPIPVTVKSDRYRGRYAELSDPDGHTVVLFGGVAAAKRVASDESVVEREEKASE